MRYNFLIFLFLLAGVNLSAKEHSSENNKYQIKLDVPEYPNTKVHLVSYWKDAAYAIDSVVLSDKGQGILTQDKELDEGQYMLLIKPNIQLNILVGKNTKEMDIFLDAKDISKCKVKGSKDTELLWTYLTKQVEITKKTADLEDYKQRKALNLELDAYAQSLIKQNKGSWFSTYLNGMVAIDLPHPNPQSPEEQSKNKEYLEEHYFDNIDMNDPRMWRTDYFVSTIDSYLQQCVHPSPDSRAAAASRLVKMASKNPKTKKELLIYLFDKSLNSNIMGAENTWARLYEEHMLEKKVDWISKDLMIKISTNYEMIKNNRIGMKAKNMKLISVDGDTINTNYIGANYTLLYFYDTSCSHCIHETPELLKIYKQYQDKGLKVVAINVQPNVNVDLWKQYVNANGLSQWVNCSDKDYETDFWLHYDVTGTPKIYLLDANGIILARDINHKAIPQVLDFYIEN